MASPAREDKGADPGDYPQSALAKPRTQPLDHISELRLLLQSFVNLERFPLPAYDREVVLQDEVIGRPRTPL